MGLRRLNSEIADQWREKLARKDERIAELEQENARLRDVLREIADDPHDLTAGWVKTDMAKAALEENENES